MKRIRIHRVLLLGLTLSMLHLAGTHESAEDKTGKIMTKFVVGTISTMHAAFTLASGTPQDANLAPVSPTVEFGIGAVCFLSVGYDLIKLCLPRRMNDNQIALVFRD